MLISNYAIVKLERNPSTRCWRILGQCNDIPGECHPAHIWPIIEKIVDDGTPLGKLERIPRTRADGFVSPDGIFGYVKLDLPQKKPPVLEAVDFDELQKKLGPDASSQ